MKLKFNNYELPIQISRVKRKFTPKFTKFIKTSSSYRAHFLSFHWKAFKVQLLNPLFRHHDTSLLFSLSRSLKGWQSPAGNAQTTSSNKNGRQYANQVCTRGVINKEKCRLTLTNHRQARRRTDATAWILTIRVTVIRRASGIAYLDTSNMSSRVQYV